MLQKGFTLIELMIVVAIIGILSMIALPSYQDYTKRTYVSEGMALANTAKLAMIEYFAINGEWPRNNELAGLARPTDIKGQAVTSIEINRRNTNGLDGGHITIKFNEKVMNGRVLVLRSDGQEGSMKWICSGKNTRGEYSPIGGTSEAAGLRIKWLPTNCRNNLIIN